MNGLLSVPSSQSIEPHALIELHAQQPRTSSSVTPSTIRVTQPSILPDSSSYRAESIEPQVSRTPLLLLVLLSTVGSNSSLRYSVQQSPNPQGYTQRQETSSPSYRPNNPYFNPLSSRNSISANEAVSKGRQGREAQNIVKVYLANLRLKGVATDVLITAYEPVFINPLSASARTVGAGPAVPAADSGCLPMAEVFKHAVTSFTVHDWSLFGAVS